MLSVMRFRSVLLGLMVAVLALGFGLAQPRDASAEVGGDLPPAGTGGMALILYSGGSLDNLQAELFGQGCGVQSYWVTRDGAWVGYNVGAPSFVNAKFVALFPGEQLPANTVLLVVCIEGGVGGPDPTPTPSPTPSSSVSDPMAGRYVCGPAGNEAVIEITDHSYYPYITQASSNTAVMNVRYRFPAGARVTHIDEVIPTRLGFPSAGEIREKLNGSGPTNPDGSPVLAPVTVIIGVYFPKLSIIADGAWHEVRNLTTPVFSKDYFHAYAVGDVAGGASSGWTFPEMAEAFGIADDPYRLEEPPVISFMYELDGLRWSQRFSFEAGAHSCNFAPLG